MIDIITTTTIFTCFNTKWKKHRLISININNLGLVLHSLLLIETQPNKFPLVKLDTIVDPMKNTSLTNPNIVIYTAMFFH